MKTKILLLSLCVFIFGGKQVFAQDAHRGGFLEHIGVGVKASTYGAGVDFNVSILPVLKARVGFNYFNIPYTVDKTVADITAKDDSKLDLTVKDATFTFPNGNLLLDFYPLVNVPISITGGLYFGQNNIHITGTTTSNKTFEYIGLDLTAKDNKIEGDINLGGVVKPYFGLGFGRTIPKNRVGFRCDLGAIYQGDIIASSDNIAGKSVNIHKIDFSETGEEDLLNVIRVLRWYPMVSFTLSYRIF